MRFVEKLKLMRYVYVQENNFYFRVFVTNLFKYIAILLERFVAILQKVGILTSLESYSNVSQPPCNIAMF